MTLHDALPITSIRSCLSALPVSTRITGRTWLIAPGVPKFPPITAPSPIGARVWITAGYSACKHQLRTHSIQTRLEVADPDDRKEIGLLRKPERRKHGSERRSEEHTSEL